MNFTEGERSREWVKRLLEVVAALIHEEMCLTRLNPANAIKEKLVSPKPLTNYSRPVGLKEKKLDYSKVPYLLAPGELEGGGKRATDPVWSLKGSILGGRQFFYINFFCNIHFSPIFL